MCEHRKCRECSEESLKLIDKFLLTGIRLVIGPGRPFFLLVSIDWITSYLVAPSPTKLKYYSTFLPWNDLVLTVLQR